MKARSDLTGETLVLQVNKEAVVVEERGAEDWTADICNPEVVLDGMRWSKG